MEKANTDNMSPSDFSDMIKGIRDSTEPWQLRVFFYSKERNEFAKLLINNIIIINTGGIAAIPTLLAIFNSSFSSLEQKISFAFYPSILFGLGIVFAILTLVVAWFNFSYFVRVFEAAETRERINCISIFSASYKIPDQIGNSLKDFDKKQHEYLQKITLTYSLGIILPFLSIVVFLVAVVLMMTNLAKMLG